MTTSAETEVLALFVRARRVVNELKAAGKTSAAVVHQLDLDFEHAARAALRRPHPLQRSRLLRTLVRRCIPRALRTLLKRVLVGAGAR